MGRNPYNIGGNNHDNSGMVWDVVSVVVICLALALLYCFATSCGTVKEYVDREVEKEIIVYRDTTVWRDTTILVPIPLGKDKAIVSIRDTSRLETSVATRRAKFATPWRTSAEASVRSPRSQAVPSGPT